MKYQEYLFGELLSLHNRIYANLEYDTRFELLPALYQEFSVTLYNNKSRSEYDCIVAYLRDKNYSGTVLNDGKGKYKVKTERFLDWYFASKKDKEEIANNVISSLKTGTYTITARKLFKDCGYIPDFICEMTESLDREFKPEECILI